MELKRRPGFFARLLLALQTLLDQLLMILDLPTWSESPEIRLRRLRRIYYSDPKADITYRRVRDVLRGHVHKANYVYYERLLSTERLVYRATRHLRGTTRYDVLYQTRQLGDKIVGLIEQLEDHDEIAQSYRDPESAEAKTMAESRQWLVGRIEEALKLQAVIPARVVSFSTARARRKLDQLGEGIERLTLQLDEILESYAEIDAYKQALSGGGLSLLELDEEEEQLDQSSHL